jgi:antitoxin component YwqK of YwqJK toxin-antitoxin module
MRFLFSSLGLSIILSVFISCREIPEKCPEIKYDGNLTTLNGKPYSGSCSTDYKTGELNSIQTYKLGIDHGKWTFYYKNGNLETEGTFDMGKRVGLWKYYYENGQVHKKNNYDPYGKPTSSWVTYDKKGSVLNEIQN